jgi:hypothetical protein
MCGLRARPSALASQARHRCSAPLELKSLHSHRLLCLSVLITALDRPPRTAFKTSKVYRGVQTEHARAHAKQTDDTSCKFAGLVLKHARQNSINLVRHVQLS